MPRRVILAAASRWRFSAGQAESRVLQVGAFVLPLSFFWNTFDEFVLPKLLVTRLLVLVLSGLRLYRWRQGNKPAVRRTPVNLPLVAFVASAAVATLVAVNRNVALFGTYTRYEGLLTIGTYTALFFLAARALADQQDAIRLVRALSASAYIVAVAAVLQAAVSSSFLPPGVGETQFAFGGVVRATGSLGNANALAAFVHGPRASVCRIGGPSRDCR